MLGILFYKPKNIIVLETNIYKLRIIKNYFKNIKIIKATHKKKTIVEKIKSINEGELVDYVVDCSGNIQAMNNCLDYIKNDGKFIFASHPDYNKKLQINPHDLIKGKKIIGSWGGGFKIERDIEILNYFLNKVFFKSNLRKLIRWYKLVNINRAISDIKRGKVFKAILIH